MNLTRVSLYAHELEVIARLTVDLTRLRLNADERVEDIGPLIFGRLADALYRRGRWSYADRVADSEFAEVT